LRKNFLQLGKTFFLRATQEKSFSRGRKSFSDWLRDLSQGANLFGSQKKSTPREQIFFCLLERLEPREQIFFALRKKAPQVEQIFLSCKQSNSENLLLDLSLMTQQTKMKSQFM
jgi:hypothetical protein